MSGILRIANLCKAYSITYTERQEVLKGINAELEAGEFVALLGESGCGKSTLLHILGGMDTDYTGSIVVKGKFIRDFSEEEMDDYRKRGVGMIFQNYNLIPHMNLVENVEIALELSDVEKEDRRNRALDLLNIVGLKNYADKLPNQLSGGQKQRVAIARALANNPSILLADEPTGALDKESTEDIILLLKKIASMGKLVVVVTHSEAVANNCTRVLKMEDGVIKEDIVREKPKKNKYEKYSETKPKNIKFKSILRLAFKNILSNSKRNLFVSIGISIGILALIIILCLSDGITSYVKDYYANDEMSTLVMTYNNKNITSSQLDEINGLYGVDLIYKSHRATSATYTYDSDSLNMGVIYCYHEKTITPEILYGNSCSSDDEIVINVTFANELSKEGIIASVGQTIDVTYQDNLQTFKIVGIYDDDSNMCTSYISLSDMQEFFTSSSFGYNLLYVKAIDITYLESVEDSIKDLGYTTVVFDDSSSTILNYIDLGTNVLVAVSLIATTVAAIMIIVAEYISVLERTQEIGILRAIGGRKKDISRLFITEAAYLGFIGGSFGIVFSLVLSLIVNVITKMTMNYFFISFNPLYYLLGIIVAVLVSILAGIAPSKKASGLDPVEALRAW